MSQHPLHQNGQSSKVSCLRKVPVRVIVGTALVLTTLALLKTNSFALADREWALAVQPLPSPACANSAEPQLTVQGDRTILSWIERDGPRATLKLAERSTAGWSDPRVVVSSTSLFVNSADVPSVRALADGTLAAHVVRPSSQTTPNPAPGA